MHCSGAKKGNVCGHKLFIKFSFCFLFIYDQKLYHCSAEPCGRMQRAGREQTSQHGQAKGLSITALNQTLSMWSCRGASAPTVWKTEKSFHFSPRCKHPLWGLIIYAFLRVLMTHSNVRLCWVADIFDKINLLILWRNQWRLHSVLKVINSWYAGSQTMMKAENKGFSLLVISSLHRHSHSCSYRHSHCKHCLMCKQKQ